MASVSGDHQLEPAEIARETIRHMAQRRIVPTPDNYQRVYNEIARLRPAEPLEVALAQALKRLPRDSGDSNKWIAAWEALLVERNWQNLPKLLMNAMDEQVAHSRRWPDAIRDLLHAWEVRQLQLTPQRKKEALERVLINFGSDPQLPEKLQAMAASWSNYVSIESGTAVKDEPLIAAVEQQQLVPAAVGSRVASLQKEVQLLQETLRQALQHGLLPRLDGYPELRSEAERLLQLSTEVTSNEQWQTLMQELKSMFIKVELVGVDEQAIRQDLLTLLKLLVDNISELVSDDQWLRGQIAVVQTIISGPLQKSDLAAAGQSLKEVIFRQSTLKHSLTEAKHNFKQMVATFIERLGTIADTTGTYHNKVAGYNEQLSRTDDILQISALVESLMQDTGEMQSDLLRSQELLIEQRSQATAAEERVRQLEMELVSLSEKVRIDQLTNVLNRRGLEEALARETARVQRGEGTLSLALLDIDNFKRINDTRGHETGDAALQHLAGVVQETIRPMDVVARFGGEEFVVLLPHTSLNEAVTLVTRLQRELTRKIFLHDNRRLLITFSAGVALYDKTESPEYTLHRADQAMYLAKSTGKNRVMTENDLAHTGIQLQSFT